MAAYSMICWGTIQTQLQRRLLGLGSAVRLWAMAVCIATEFALEDLYADVAGANPVLAKSIAEAARWFSTKEGNVGMPLVCCKNSVMHMSGRPMHMHMQVRLLVERLGMRGSDSSDKASTRGKTRGSDSAASSSA